MSTRIEFVARDGRPMTGELFAPTGTGKHPALIVVHEWWGLNDDIRRLCGAFAAEGVLALAIDLYGGRVTTDAGVARTLVTELKTLEAMEIIAGAAQRLGSHARGDGKVFVTGFCVGGAMALAASCNVDGLAGAIPFYGVPLPQYADWSRRRCRVDGHYGSNDGSIPVAKVEAMVTAMRAGSDAPVQMHFYQAGHAFMRAADPKAYDERAAHSAWARAIAFIRENTPA